MFGALGKPTPGESATTPAGGAASLFGGGGGAAKKSPYLPAREPTTPANAPIKEQARILASDGPYNFEVHVTKDRFLFAEKALYVWRADSKSRIALVSFITHWSFNWFILLCIGLNSLAIAMQDYSDKGLLPNPNDGDKLNPSDLNSALEVIGLVFTIIFTVEAVLKTFGMGFCLDPGSYLRDAWNVLDFVVVVAGLLGMIPGMPNVSALRTIRVLRPLRALSTLPKMRVLIASLLTSLPALGNVIILMGFIFSIFGILGIQVWKGLQHYRCRPDQFPTLGEDGETWVWPVDEETFRAEFVCSVDSGGMIGGYHCPVNYTCGANIYKGGLTPENAAGAQVSFTTKAKRWEVGTDAGNYVEGLNWGFTNFDNMWFAFFTIFQSITEEGWTDIMYQLMDAYSPAFAACFFVLLIMFGSWFSMNLIFAVIWEQFTEAHEQQQAQMHKKMSAEKKKRLAQGRWKRSFAKVKQERKRKSFANFAKIAGSKYFQNPLVKVMNKLVTHNLFNGFIIFCIVLNTARRDFAEHFFQIGTRCIAQLRARILIPAECSAVS